MYDPQKEPIILQGSVQISWMDQILAVAANDSMITNAILCAAAGSIYAMTLEKEHAMMSTFFKVQAIQELRVRVANPKSDDHALASNAAYTISLLIWIEVSTGRRSTFGMLMSFSVWPGIYLTSSPTCWGSNR